MRPRGSLGELTVGVEVGVGSIGRSTRKGRLEVKYKAAVVWPNYWCRVFDPHPPHPC